MYNEMELHLSKLLGPPINLQRPVSNIITKVCNFSTVDPAEIVQIYKTADNTLPIVYEYHNGELIAREISGIRPTTLDINLFKTPLEIISLSDAINFDPTVGGRVLERLTIGLDRKEVYDVIQACLALDGTSGNPDQQITTAESGEDLFDLFVKLVEKIEDKGDDYIGLIGATINSKLNTYDHDVAGDMNYPIGIRDALAKMGIKEIIKVNDSVELGSGDPESGSTETKLLDDTAVILIAKKSYVSASLPITFVRRRFPVDVNLINTNVEKKPMERINVVVQLGHILDANDINNLSWGIAGVGASGLYINNYTAIALCKNATAYLS